MRVVADCDTPGVIHGRQRSMEWSSVEIFGVVQRRHIGDDR
jgi:hypothetical protein